MKKGDIMLCNAVVVTDYSYKDFHHMQKDTEIIHTPEKEKFPKKCLYRINKQESIECMLIGKTYLATGYLHVFDYEYDQAYLVEDKRHPVWKCVPYSPSDDRYYKPFFALEKDLKSRILI